jgi:hypothetical protein
LDHQRERWLNPPEGIAPIAQNVDALDDFADVAAASGEEARQLIRRSAIMVQAARHARLKQRTLTKLYNERPTRLAMVHEKLDRAVLAAYATVARLAAGPRTGPKPGTTLAPANPSPPTTPWPNAGPRSTSRS